MTRFVTAVLGCVLAIGSAAVTYAQEPATPLADAVAAHAADAAAEPQPATARPVAIEYSDAYYTRAKIHKYASFATLPLFATEVALGQSIYNDANAAASARRGAHIAVGTGITALFAVNTVTGAWNMWESRHDPSHHRAKLLHGILMMGADAGFVATFASGPGGRAGVTLDSEKQTHRTIALTSMGIATGSYLLMLFGNK
ncbi:MAG: putative rane protein [Acidobacteria bacterium]|nr:putative rane protein [Acidobacteriota bacterium]